VTILNLFALVGLEPEIGPMKVEDVCEKPGRLKLGRQN
jgi:hypothetical protein